NMVLGYFGRTPAPPNPEIVKLASEQLGKPVFTDDPLDILEAGIPKATKLLEENELPVTDENIFIVASCEQKGLDFLLGKAVTNVRKISDQEVEPKAAPAARPAAGAPLGERNYSIVVNDRAYQVSVSDGGGIQARPAAAEPAAALGTVIDAPTPGNVVKVLVETGQSVKANQPIVILEAMKMESEVKAPSAGKVLAIHVTAGDTVQAGDMLLTIG
uniref:biotin/lipoyl-containing protein n=1 Tax=Desulfogranum mediterraneum TaxID=160661 RepID=UPI00048F189A